MFTCLAKRISFLLKQKMQFKQAINTAIGMSLISMLAMETAMNLTDFLIMGGAILVWWIIPIMLIAGFVTAWPYNYWRLKKFNISCH